MSWLGKIFSKKEVIANPEEPRQKAFSINDLKEFLGTHYKKEMSPFLEAAKAKYGEIQNAADGFQKSLENLAAANYTDPVDPYLLSVVVGRRRNFIQKMTQVAKQLKTPIKYDFDSILNYNNSASFSLNHANATTVEDYGQVVELLRKEAASAVSNFRRIENLLKELGFMVEHKNNFVNSMASSNGKLLLIERGLAAISEKEKLIGELRAGIKTSDADQLKISDDIANLEKSDEWKTNREMLKRRDELQAQKSELSSEMTQIISPLVKPIKKFKNLLDNNRESFENKKFVEALLDDYIDAIVLNDIAIFNSLLEKLKENILGKKIDLKERTSKILQTIDALRENDTLASLKNDYETLSREIEGLKIAIANSQIEGIKKKLETGLESVKRKRGEQSARLLNEEPDLKLILAKLEKDKSELELQVGSLTNTKINLDLKLPLS